VDGVKWNGGRYVGLSGGEVGRGTGRVEGGWR
jgi:hypothetical protein